MRFRRLISTFLLISLLVSTTACTNSKQVENTTETVTRTEVIEKQKNDHILLVENVVISLLLKFTVSSI